MASLTWDDSQRRWTQQAPSSSLEAVAARRKARPLLTGLAGGLLHGSPSEMDALLPDLQPKPETVAHHQANLQQTQVQMITLHFVLMSVDGYLPHTGNQPPVGHKDERLVKQEGMAADGSHLVGRPLML